jgi:hypothetical protein
MSPITPAIEAPIRLPVPYRQQSADRHLALIDRYEVSNQRHCDRKHSARHQSGRDPHNEQRKARGHCADQRRNRNHEQA